MADTQKLHRAIRCAVYTRKSSEEGLDQEFNSLHAQREACEAYVRSQKHAGWSVLPARYDDGGYSGGTMQRPALERLLADIRAKKIGVVMVYKIDRLTRSLFDFAKIVEIFDAAGVSFVSVTQQFNTTTSMGRLTLNVLLSFAQFEREVTGERIRDKIAASKKKGMWMGGNVPLGYEAKERKLHVVEREAQIIRRLYELYLELGNVRRVKEEADRIGLKTRSIATSSGSLFSRGHIYKILSNPLYAGRVAHQGQVYDGQHASIIPADLWTGVQRELQDRAVKAKSRPGAKERSPLAGVLFDHTGDRLTPSHAVKKGRRYRYYIANRLIREKKNAEALRLPAAEIETATSAIVLDLLNDQRKMFDLLNAGQTGLAEEGLRQAQRLRDDLNKLGVHEQLLQIKPALEKIVVGPDNLTITLGADTLRALLMGEAARARPPQNNEQMPNSFAIEAAFTVRRRGREMRLILNSSQRATQAVDKSLIGLVSRGYAWRHEIADGTAASATVIAQREKLTPAYVSRLVDLSFLAPDILAGVVCGETPADLTASKLQSISNIPLDWPSQRTLLGFS